LTTEFDASEVRVILRYCLTSGGRKISTVFDSIAVSTHLPIEIIGEVSRFG